MNYNNLIWMITTSRDTRCIGKRRKIFKDLVNELGTGHKIVRLCFIAQVDDYILKTMGVFLPEEILVLGMKYHHAYQKFGDVANSALIAEVCHIADLVLRQVEMVNGYC